jgi:hypothetical protein
MMDTSHNCVETPITLVGRLWDGRPGFYSRQSRISHLFTALKPTLRPIQPLIQWKRVHVWRLKLLGVKLTTNFLLVRMLRMRGVILPLPHTPHGIVLRQGSRPLHLQLQTYGSIPLSLLIRQSVRLRHADTKCIQ